MASIVLLLHVYVYVLVPPGEQKPANKDYKFLYCGNGCFSRYALIVTVLF